MTALTIFSNQNTAHLIELFLWMFGAFLIGYFFARYYYKNTSPKSKSTYIPEDNQEDAFTPVNIKAKKTMERGGIQVKPTAPNFDRIGIADASEKDDLQQIKGVGPFIEEKLNTIGIYTYQQISKFTSEDIETITDLIEFFPGRMQRDDWTGQAKALLKEIKK